MPLASRPSAASASPRRRDTRSVPLARALQLSLVLILISTPCLTGFAPPAFQEAYASAAPLATTYNTQLWQTVTFKGNTYQVWLVLDPRYPAPLAGAALRRDQHDDAVEYIYVTRNGDRVDDPQEEIEVMFLAQNNLLIQDAAVWQEWSTHLASTDDGEQIDVASGGTTVDLYIPKGLNPDNGTRDRVIAALSDQSKREELYAGLFRQMAFPGLDHADLSEVEGIFDEDMNFIYRAALEYADGGVGGVLERVNHPYEWLDLFAFEMDAASDVLILKYINDGVPVPRKLKVFGEMAEGMGDALDVVGTALDIASITDDALVAFSRYMATLIYLQGKSYDRLEALRWFVDHYPTPSSLDPAVPAALTTLEDELRELVEPVHIAGDLAQVVWNPFFSEIFRAYSPDAVSTWLDIADLVGGILWTAFLPQPAGTIVGVCWTTGLQIAWYVSWVNDTYNIVAQSGLALTLETMMGDTLWQKFSTHSSSSDLLETRHLMLTVNHRLYAGFLFYRILLKRYGTGASVFNQWFLPDSAPAYTQTKLQFRFDDFVITLPLGYLETADLWLGAATLGPAIVDVLPVNITDYTVGSTVQGRVQVVANTTLQQAQCRYWSEDLSQNVWLATDTNGGDGWGCNWNTTGLAPGVYYLQIYVKDAHQVQRIETTAVRLLSVTAPAINVTVAPDQPSYAPGASVALNVTLRDSTSAAVTAATLQYSLDAVAYTCSTGGVTCTDLGGGNYTIRFSAPGSSRNYDVVVNATKAGYQPGTGATTITVYAPVATGHDVVVNQPVVSKSGSNAINVVNVHVYNNGSYIGTAPENVTLYFRSRNPSGAVLDTQSVTFNVLKGQTSADYSRTLSVGASPADGSYPVEVEAVINGGFIDQYPLDNKKGDGVWFGAKPTFNEYGLRQMYGLLGQWATNSTGGTSVDGYYMRVNSVNYTSDYARVDIASGSTGNIIHSNATVYLNRLSLFDGNNFAVICTGLVRGPDGAIFDVGRGGNTGVTFTPGTAVVPAGTQAKYHIAAPSSAWSLRYFTVDTHENGDDYATVSTWSLDDDQILGPWDVDLYLSVPANATPKTYSFWLRFDDRNNVLIYDDILRKLFAEVHQPHNVQISGISPNGGSVTGGNAVPIVATLQNLSSEHTEYAIPVSARMSGPSGYQHSWNPQTIATLSPSGSGSVTFNWTTAGLAEGSYSLVVDAPLPLDVDTTNNSTARTYTLVLPPQLMTTAAADKGTYTQQEQIQVGADVTSGGSAITDATVTYYLRDVSSQIVRSGTLTHTANGHYVATFSAPSPTGTYALAVTAGRDGYRTGTAPVISVAVATAPPQTIILSSSTTEGQLIARPDAQFSWTGSAFSAPASQLQYAHRLDVQPWSPFGAATSVALTGMAEGPHTFQVKARLPTGLEDPTPAAWSFTVDTIPPAFDVPPAADRPYYADGETVHITADLSEAANLGTGFSAIDTGYSPARVSVTETDPAGHVYRIDYQISSGNTTPDLATLLTLHAVDTAGNSGLDSGLTIRLDNTAPSVVSTSPGNDETGVDVRPTLSVVFSEAMNQTTTQPAFTILPSVGGQFSWPYPHTMTFTPQTNLAENTQYTFGFAAGAADEAGRTLPAATWSFRTGLGRPGAPTGLTATPAGLAQINLHWSDNSSDESDFRIERSLNGSTGWAEIGTAPANSTTATSAGLACGSRYYYRVRAHRSGDDRYSLYSNVADAWTATCAAPAIAGLEPASATAGGPAFTLTVNGSGFLNGASTVRWNGSARPTTFISGNQLRASIAAADIAGVGTPAVTVVNSAPGSGASNSVTFTIGSAPPPNRPPYVPTNPGPVNHAANVSVTRVLTWTTRDPDAGDTIAYDVYLDAGTTAPVHVVCDDVAVPSCDPPGAMEYATTYTWKVVATDNHGASAASALWQFTTTAVPNPVPEITSLNPASTPVGGAAFTLEVTGSGFVDGSTVRWNGAARATTFVSTGRLEAAIPVNVLILPGTVEIVVFNPEPGGGTSNAMLFSIVPSADNAVYVPLVLR